MKTLFVTAALLALASRGAALPPRAADAAVEIRARRIEYFLEEDRIEATGDVRIRQGEEVLEADAAGLQRDTQDVHARGRVRFRAGRRAWEGEQLTYNLGTGRGDFDSFAGFIEPFYLHSGRPLQFVDGELFLEQVLLSTCDRDPPHHRAQARQVRVGEDWIHARHVVFYVGPVPVFYLPAAVFPRQADRRIIFIPGYASRWGAYALTGYRYDLTAHGRGVTRLDYRTRRGVAVGQELRWNRAGTFDGKLQAALLLDQNPMIGRSAQKEAYGGVARERYRVRLQHRQEWSPADTLRADFSYLSDPFVLYDFFRREDLHGAEPETRAAYTHRGAGYTVTVAAEKRLNDFYPAVDRLPEVTLDLPRRRLGVAGPYYESRTAAAGLRRLYPRAEEQASYGVLRIDSDHRLIYPTRHFGFLNIVPDAGYRMTYYSKTRTPDVPGEDPASRDETEAGAGVRWVLSAGSSMSFKAFREYLPPPPSGWGGLRHVSEPYARYRLVPRPNLVPAALYAFDAIDGVDQRHVLLMGWRNSLQTQRAGRVRNLLDVHLHASWHIHDVEEQRPFSPLVFDLELDPAERIWVRFQGDFDLNNTEVPRFSARQGLVLPDGGEVRAEYRYERTRTDLLRLELDIGTRRAWAVGAYGRYNLEGRQLEEQGYYLRRKGHCQGWAVGYHSEGRDWDVWLQFWLLAFPDAVLDIKGHW